MEKSSRGTGRRTLLQRALALVAGGVALGSGVRLTRGSPVHAETAADPSLIVYARTRPFVVPPSGRPAASAASTQVSSGELLDAPDGKAIGSFVTNCICEVGGTVLGIAHPSLEFQALELREGTLYGMCSGPGPDGSKCHAIVGGTGRFAGARGAYVERAVATQSTRHDVIQFVVTLAV
jgi:hypothetical protein